MKRFSYKRLGGGIYETSYKAFYGDTHIGYVGKLEDYVWQGVGIDPVTGYGRRVGNGMTLDSTFFRTRFDATCAVSGYHHMSQKRGEA